MAEYLTTDERRIAFASQWSGIAGLATIADSTDHIHQAPTSAKITCTGTSTVSFALLRVLGLKIQVKAGQKINVGAWGFRGTATGTMQAGIQWYDNTGTPTTQTLGPTAGSLASWVPFSVLDAVAPADGYMDPIITIASMTTGQTFYFADARVWTKEPPWAMQNQPTNAWMARRARGSLLQAPGVRGGVEMQVVQRGAGKNMSVDVLPGAAYVQGSDLSAQGMYYVESDAKVNIPISDADGLLKRYTTIFAKVIDTQFSLDSGPPAPDSWDFVAIDGTYDISNPLPVPDQPSALRLADIFVNKNARAILQSNINDQRTYLQTKGAQIYTLDGSRILYQANTGPWVQCNQRGWATGWAFVPYKQPFPNKTLSVTVTDTGPWGNNGKIRIVTLPSQRRDGFWVVVFYDNAPYRGLLLLQWQAIGV